MSDEHNVKITHSQSKTWVEDMEGVDPGKVDTGEAKRNLQYICLQTWIRC